MKAFYSIGIDKLTLCYVIEDDSPLHSLTPEDEYLDLGDFQLQRIPSGHFKNSFRILSLWDSVNGEGLTRQVFGVLKFSRYTDTEEKTKLAWVYFDNHTLYKQVYPQVSSVIYGEYISENLGLQLRNITELEIYLDTNRNAPKAIKHMIRNPNISTIYNGKVLERKEKQNKLGYYHTGNLNRYLDMTFYAKQADKDGFVLKAYNKASEIEEESHKEYIFKWHNRTKNNPLFRIEVTLKHNHIKEYIRNKMIELNHCLFINQEFLLNCFLHFANRLLRFRDKDMVYSLLEVV